MATDDQLTSTPSSTKRPISRKHRVLTHIHTTGNNGLSRLPSVISKSTVCLSSSETIHFKRYRPQPKDILNTSSTTTRIERQTTNLASQGRLPPLALNDNHHKQRSDYQRRQIYALNHLMRELEQEQFRQFCQLNGVGTENSEEIVSNEEEPNKESSTVE